VATKEQAARLSGVVLGSLEEPCTTGALARRAFHSRTQFHSLFRALVEETPAAMRRRLLLERAAWSLANTARSVTEVALDANYGSLEAFTRAFRKAYSASPSLYRRIRTDRFRLPSPNGIHFVTPATNPKGALEMDLLDRFAGNDSWHTRNLLTSAASLTDDQLDRPLKAVVEILPWREKTNSLRQLLENIIFTKEVWTAALTGKSMDVNSGTAPDRKTPAAMLQRLEETDAELSRVLCEVNSRGAWDDTFVDALCEPPETFTYGGVFAHIMTFNAHRRIMALDAFRELGVHIEGFGCPIEYEQQVTRS
jgi:AraC family transcriptional regulator